MPLNLHPAYDGMEYRTSGLMPRVYDVAMQSQDPRTRIGCVIRTLGKKGAHRHYSMSNNTICGGSLEDYLKHMSKHDALEHAERLAIHLAREDVRIAYERGVSSILAVNEVPCASCARAIALTHISEVYICGLWQLHVTENGPDPSARVAAAREIFRRNNIKFYIDPAGSIGSVARRDDMDFIPWAGE